MDKQDILKALLDAAPSIPAPAFVKFLEDLAISSTKEDPIDRQEAYYNETVLKKSSLLSFVKTLSFSLILILAANLFASPSLLRNSAYTSNPIKLVKCVMNTK